MNKIMVVGLDVHKDSISVAIAENGTAGPRFFGKLDGKPDAVLKFARQQVSRGFELRFVYEAGPCGYELYRALAAKGYACMVTAPSLIPKSPGDRQKTDRRDAVKLAPPAGRN
jgi:transposase